MVHLHSVEANGSEGDNLSGLALLPLKGPALVPAMLVEAAIMLSPCHPEMGTKATEVGL